MRDSPPQRYRIRWRNAWLVKIEAGKSETIKTVEEWTGQLGRAKTWTLEELTKFHHHIVAGYTRTELEPV